MNSTIQGALLFIEDYCKDNEMPFDEDFYYERVMGWYNNSDIADQALLAAAAIECDYDNSIGTETIYEYGEKYFGELTRQLLWEDMDNELKEGGRDDGYIFWM